jgi:ABC-type multidrug transport system fused ATPase/permease subunit
LNEFIILVVKILIIIAIVTMIASRSLISACFVLFGSLAAAIYSKCFILPSDTLPHTYEPLGRDERFILKPRLAIWIRQIAFLTILLTKFAHPLSLNRHSFRPDEAIIYSSILISLLFDGIGNINVARAKISWCIVYSLALPIFINFFTQSLTPIDLLRLGLYITAFLSTLYEIIFASRIPQKRPLTKEFTCGLFEYCSMSHLNKILIEPMQTKIMEFADVPPIIDSDTASYCFETIKKTRRHKYSLVYQIFLLIFDDWLPQGFFQWFSDTAVFLSPIALQVILGYVSNKSELQYSSILKKDISVYTAALVFFASPFLRALCDCQNFLRAKRISMRVRAALVTAIYEKALVVNLAAYKEGPGKINNLISVDVNNVQEFACYSHFLWGTMYNIILCLSLLYLVLGIAALWGLAMMMIFMVFGLVVSKLLEKYQGDVLKDKDKRMSIVNEVLNGIRIIKLFAWEDNFLAKLAHARSVELSSLRKWIYTNMVQKIMWDVAPVAVACTAFIIHVYVYDRHLSPPVGYAALTLFNQLRFPLGVFPEMIACLVSARVSMDRINVFLATENVLGLESQFRPPKDAKDIIQVKNLSLGWKPTRANEDETEISFYDRLRQLQGSISNLMRPMSWKSSKSTNRLNETKYSNISTVDSDTGLEMSTAIDISSHGILQPDSSDAIINPLSKASSQDLSANSDFLIAVLAKLTFSMPRGSLIVIAGPTGNHASFTVAYTYS